MSRNKTALQQTKQAQFTHVDLLTYHDETEFNLRFNFDNLQYLGLTIEQDMSIDDLIEEFAACVDILKKMRDAE